MRALSTILREFPLALGLGVGVGMPLWLGRAWHLGDGPRGYGWPEYLTQAYVVSRRIGTRYNPFRNPFHAELVGQLGDVYQSFVDSAVVVSSASMALVVLSAALAGRALGGPWAGAVAAATIGLLRVHVDATAWANHYPLLGATIALGVTGAVWVMRAEKWPAVLLSALLAGVGGGLALAADRRGMLVLPLLVLAALVPVVRRPTRRFWVPLVVLLPLSLGPLITQNTRPVPEAHIDPEKMATIQQEVVQRFVRLSKDSALQAACPEQAAFLTPAVVLGPCGPAMVRYNATRILPHHLPYGLPATGLALLLWCLPARRGRWAVVQGGLAAATLVGGLVLVMAVTPMPHRYALPSVLLLHLAVPVAVHRLLATLLPAAAAAHWMPRAALVTLAGLALVHPAEHREARPGELNQQTTLARRALPMVLRNVGYADGLLDCSLSAVEAARLPRISALNTPPNRVTEKECRAWIERPSPPPSASATYLITLGHPRPERIAALHQQARASSAWTAVDSSGMLVLYRWTGGE